MSFYPADTIDLPNKRNKGIISRMKRSLSTNGNRPHIPVPLKLSSTTVPISETSPFSTTPSTASPMDRSFSPIPTPTKSISNFYPTPTTHLSYETFSASTANLSVRSFDKRGSFVIDSSNNKKKSMFETRVERDKHQLVTGYAPSPAMYWSRPDMFGMRPPKLRAHASAEYNGNMYVFGGTSKTLCSDTLYVLDLDTFTWSVPRTYGTPPPACRAHSLLAHPKNGKLYLFGGGDGQRYYHHFYVLDIETMTWSCPKTTGPKPSERRAHAAVLWQQDMYVFGGGDGAKALNDLHKLDLKTWVWSPVQTTGDQPNPRGYHTGNMVGDKLVVFGGSDGKECFGDIHVLDLPSRVWKMIDLDHTMPRLSHATLHVGSFLFILAGHDGAKYCNELVMLNLVNMAWETKKVYGQAPTPRGYHTSLLYDSRIFLFGGFDGTTLSDEVYVLDLSSYAYLPQILNFSIDS